MSVPSATVTTAQPSDVSAASFAIDKAGACEPAEPAQEAVSGLPHSARLCVNCEAALPQPVTPYCPQCGQETHIRPPKLGEFIQQFGGHYLATEGALWRSLYALLFRPGFLSTEYLRGRRKHYVLPLRLYISISLVLLLVLGWNLGPELQVLQGPKQAAAAPASAASLPGGPAASGTPTDPAPLREAAHQEKASRPVDQMDLNVNLGGWRPIRITPDGVQCEGLPVRMCERLKHRFSSALWKNPYEVEQYAKRAISLAGSAMFVLLPLFAVWLRLLFSVKGMHYTEHLVVALHLHAFWFAVLIALELGGKVLDALLLGLLLLVCWQARPHLATWRNWAKPWLRWDLQALARWSALLVGLALLSHDMAVFALWMALPLYTLRALQHIYGLKTWSTVWRMLLLGFLNLNVLGVAVGVVMLLAAVV